MSFKSVINVSMVLCLASLVGCSGGVCDSNGSNSLNPLSVNLSLDYVGTVPVLDGNATTSYFYVHNDGESAISGISYSLANGSNSGNDIVDSNGFKLYGSSLSNCAMIAAKSSCKISFTTPSLTLGNQNNSLFKVTVIDGNGFKHYFDQVINYSYYNVELNSGVNFATSADVVAQLSGKRYMMSYLIAGGKAGRNYNNVNLEISDGGSMSVNQGFTNGSDMVSGELIPIEFAVNVLSVQPTPVNIVPQYSVNSLQRVHSLQANTVLAGQGLYVNTSSQTNSVMALKVGVIPLLIAPSDASNGKTIFVSNFGESFNGLTIEPADSKIQVYNNNCSGVIESNASCSFVLGVNGSGNGSSNLVFKAKGTVVATSTVYYKGSSADAFLTSTTPLNQLGLQPNQNSSVINITFSNLGTLDAENLEFTPHSVKTTSLSILNNGCGNRLAANSQCIIQVQVQGGDAGETGTIYVAVTGKSGANPITSQSNDINYYVADNSNIMISSPKGAESSLNIFGNGYESAQTVFTFKNIGSTSSSINSLDLTGVDLPSELMIISNTCGTSLAAGSSCQVTVKYGPHIPESNISGIANLQLNYGVRRNTLSGTIKYSTTASDSYFKITNVTASGYTGSGSESNPYSGSGCNNVPLLISITYKNMSVNYAAQNMALNIIDGHVSPYMSVESNLTTCGYGSKVESVGIGQSCTLVLKADRNAMIDNSSFNLDVLYPSASWSTSQGFVRQDGFTYNGSTKTYATYSQPTLVSNISPTTGDSLQRTLSQTFIGGTGCGDFTTTISAIPYVESVIVLSGNCSVNNDKSVNCTNSSSAESNMIQYRIESGIPRPANLFTVFDLSNSDKYIWYNPKLIMFSVESNVN